MTADRAQMRAFALELPDTLGPMFGRDVALALDALDEAEKVIREYGGHKPGCSMPDRMTDECSCGWDSVYRAALDRIGEK